MPVPPGARFLLLFCTAVSVQWNAASKTWACNPYLQAKYPTKSKLSTFWKYKSHGVSYLAQSLPEFTYKPVSCSIIKTVEPPKKGKLKSTFFNNKNCPIIVSKEIVTDQGPALLERLPLLDFYGGLERQKRGPL